MRLISAYLLIALSAAAPALAHHSFAMFDPKTEVTLTGTIKEVQWTNPHAWIEVLVPGEHASADQWSVECLAPNGLTRMGWKSSSLKAGDKVVIKIHPLRDGTKGGSLIMAMYGDGRPVGTIPGGVPLPPGA